MCAGTHSYGGRCSRLCLSLLRMHRVCFEIASSQSHVIPITRHPSHIQLLCACVHATKSVLSCTCNAHANPGECVDRW